MDLSFAGKRYLIKAQASLQGAIDSLLRGWWWGPVGTAKEKDKVDSRLPSLFPSDPSSPPPPPPPPWCGDGGASVRRRPPGTGSTWSGDDIEEGSMTWVVTVSLLCTEAEENWEEEGREEDDNSGPDSKWTTHSWGKGELESRILGPENWRKITYPCVIGGRMSNQNLSNTPTLYTRMQADTLKCTCYMSLDKRHSGWKVQHTIHIVWNFILGFWVQKTISGCWWKKCKYKRPSPRWERVWGKREDKWHLSSKTLLPVPDLFAERQMSNLRQIEFHLISFELWVLGGI